MPRLYFLHEKRLPYQPFLVHTNYLERIYTITKNKYIVLLAKNKVKCVTGMLQIIQDTLESSDLKLLLIYYHHKLRFALF